MIIMYNFGYTSTIELYATMGFKERLACWLLPTCNWNLISDNSLGMALSDKWGKKRRAITSPSSK